eukprot:3883-Rhodomonas_salina.2
MGCGLTWAVAACQYDLPLVPCLATCIDSRLAGLTAQVSKHRWKERSGSESAQSDARRRRSLGT